MTLRRALHTVLTLFAAACCVSCMDFGPAPEEKFDFAGRGVFIVNEGNFNYGNASLSYYDPDTKKIENGIFARSNGIPLGDVAQSMTIYDGRGYIVVNNSGVIFVIDLATFRIIGTIDGLTSPRYICFYDEHRAYVTDLYDTRITKFDPATLKITGHIETGYDSTERIVAYDRFLLVACWSYNDKIIVIDTDDDTVCDTISVGIQPSSLVLDRNGKIWVLTDGGYEGSPYGYTAPALYRIDAATRRLEKEFTFALGDSATDLQIDANGETLYFIRNDVWRMSVDADRLPDEPFIRSDGAVYYGLGIDPVTSEIYLSDAVDYMQAGTIARYSPTGELLDRFRAGITPNSFAFK
ncbi:MAG: YncE family protein [Alistipes sp.]|nr:YncE family protein [Alistipes sp.]